jgi:hypothetical protein
MDRLVHIKHREKAVKLLPPEAVACFMGQAKRYDNNSVKHWIPYVYRTIVTLPAPKQEELYYYYRSWFVRCSGFQPNFTSILCEVLAFIITFIKRVVSNACSIVVSIPLSRRTPLADRLCHNADLTFWLYCILKMLYR